MVSTSVTILSPSKYAPIVSWGVPFHRLPKEETTACFTHGSVHYVGTTQKSRSTAVASQPLSGTTLKDTDKEKSSQWAELPAVHTVIRFVWEEKWPDV